MILAPTTVRGLPGLLSLPLCAFHWLWCATLRLDEEGFDGVRSMFDRKTNMVIAIWHDELFSLMPYKRTLRASAVISRSHDGDWVAALLERNGVGAARGSSSRGGMSALREMTQRVRDGESAIITVDGPRGPRHKAKPGAIHLAVRENVPIVPCRLFIEHSKKLGSWDRFQLPLPFSRVRMIWGEPYMPTAQPDGTSFNDDTQLAAACAELERRLNDLLPDPVSEHVHSAPPKGPHDPS